MGSFLDFVFPWRKLRKNNLTVLKRVGIYFDILFNVLFVLFISSYLLFPYLSKTVTYKNMHMHMIGDTNKTLARDYLLKVNRYLHSNRLYADEEKVDIYIVNNAILYAIMSPMEIFNLYSSYAVTWGQNIIFKHLDLKKINHIMEKKKKILMPF